MVRQVMMINGQHYRTIWPGADGGSVEIIDQTRLPHEFVIRRLTTAADAVTAIGTMQVRGAPLIGATAAYGLALAMGEDSSDRNLDEAAHALLQTRPTAVNLRWALETMTARLRPLPPQERLTAAFREAATICDQDAAINRRIGEHGRQVLDTLWRQKQKPAQLNLLTHCNAGWLATVDWGTALAPIYLAREAGLPVHVWVDETRPRNQGASLTAWELLMAGITHTVIVDNAGGHLMQHGLVDLCIVGSDRTTAAGDVCNKIGTYLKALAAHDNGIPFYVAVPASSIDWRITDGLREIPIEERAADEVHEITGLTRAGVIEKVRVTPQGTTAANFGFDVTPARLVTGLITERGVCPATAAGLKQLFPAGSGTA